MGLFALEPRIAFDAAAVATAEQAGDHVAQQQAEAAIDQPVTNDSPDLSFSDAVVAAPMLPPARERAEIAFIDGAVANINQIIASMDPALEVVILDQTQDGLLQIASALNGRTGIDSIHIVSHGEAGTIHLGTGDVSVSTLVDYQPSLAAIGQALSDSGDIMIYGCDVAAGSGGMELVRAISAATGADVAASINNTGGTEAGGDWVLEATNGAIEGSSLSNPLYAGLLTKTNTGPTGWTLVSGTTYKNTTDGVTTTVTFTNGTGAWSAFNTAAALNNIAAFDNSAAGTGSLGASWGSAAGQTGTITITFDVAVTDPVLHLDRLGGLGGGFTNSSIWTLATSGASLTRVSGPSHFVVDSVAGTITRQVGVTPNSGLTTTQLAESSLTNTDGTAAGSVRINGTFTTLTFNITSNSGNTNFIGDGIELAFAIDAPPKAVNDTFTTVHDTALGINVRANDSDPTNDTINVTKVNGTSIVSGGPGVAVTGGVVTLNAGGNLIFTPTANYTGATSFTYTIADANGGTSTATVNGTVTNVAPTIDLNGDPAIPVVVAGGGAFSLPSVDAGVDRTVTTTFDLTGDVLPDTATGLVQLSLIDNSVRILANGVQIHTATTLEFQSSALTAGEALMRFADNTTLVTPWLVNVNGLPRVELRITEAGIEAWGTRSTTSTVLEQLFPSVGTFVLPNWVAGTNTLTMVNVNEVGVEAVSGTLAMTVQSANYAATYTENGTPVSIADVDSIVRDVDDTNMESALVTLTNPQTGDRLLVNGSSGTTGTIGTITWTRTDTTVTLTGSATKAQYAAVLAQIQFENTTDTPATTPRLINVTVNDGSVNSNTAVATINIDRAPDPTNDAFSGNEDTAISGNVLTNDTDLGDGGGTAAVVTGPTNGTLTSFDATTGAFVYTPNANFSGTDTFTYRYTDADGDSKTATVTLTISPVNDAPVNTVPATIGPVAEDATLAITGLSVADIDSGALTTTITVGNGALNLGATGGATVSGAGTGTITLTGTAAQINAALATLSYAASADYNGTSSFKISTSDGTLTTTDTRTITISPVVDIANDSISTNEDTPVTFVPLANDSFEGAAPVISAIDGSPITAGGASVAVTGGAVTLDAAGNLTFTPNANYVGTPSFTYTVASGGVTETATVNVTVKPVNDAPTQVVPAAQTTNEDSSLTISGATVADVDGDTLTTTLSLPSGAGSLSVLTGGGAAIIGNGSGTVTITGNAAQINAAIASITYAPAADFNGSLAISMATSDGSETVNGSISVTVRPVADITTDAVTTSEDTAISFNALTGTNGATADNFESAARAVTSVTQPANGVVTFAASGAMVYTPSANFNGTDTFTYTVTSGGVTETATVTVTVTAVNDAPVNTVPVAQTTLEDTPLVFSTANGNAIKVTDVDSAVTTTLTVANGNLTLGSISGVTVTGNGTGTLTVTGSAAAITAALNGLSFSPTPDWNGTTSLQVSTSDGTAPAAVSTVSITASRVVDVAPDNVTTTEDTARTFNVLSNDSFENSGATVTSVTQPANGTVTIGVGGNVTYTPATNYNGPDSFTYTVTSGGVTETTTVTLTVTPVNDAPKATAPFARTSVDGAAATYNVGGFFSDVDGDTLTFSASSLPAGLSINSATGQISGTIDGHASQGGTGGVYTVSVTATDPSGASVTRTFSWTVTNPTPVAGNDAFTGNEDTPISGSVLGNDSDPDGDVLSVNTTPVSGPTNGSLILNSNGTFTYTPNANFTGSDAFTYQVVDADGATTTATVTLYVNPINDVPQNTVPGNQATAEDTAIVFTGANAITVTDIDSPSVTTTLSVAHGTLTLGSLVGVTVTGDGTGTVTISGSPAAITAALSGLSYLNTPDYNGADTLTVVSTDGVGTTTANVALTVAPVSDITPDTAAGNEDSIITFNVMSGSNGATADSFEGVATVTAYSQPSNGTVTIDTAGNVTYTPNANFNGADTFTYTVTSGGVTETTTVTVNVANVNDAPTQALPPAQNGTEDTNVVFSGANGNQIIIGDIDPAATASTTLSVPAGTLTALAVPGVTITGNGTGTVVLSGSPAAITAALNGLSYAPVADGNGTIAISVSTTDGIAAPVTGSISIALAPVADILNDASATNEDTPVNIAVLGNDTFENSTKAVTAATNGANGAVTINPDGTVTYTPNANFNGTDTFTYTVTSGGVTETATVTVVVNSVNDAPSQVLPAAQTLAEDASLTFSSATGNAITTADLDGDTLTTTVSVTNGVINLGSVTGVTVSGNGTGTVTLSGSAADINSALNGLAYNPTADYNGSAVLSVTTTDGTATVSGTVPLTVTPVVDIASNSVSTNEDTPLTFNVLTNDSFESPSAAVSSVTQPAHGTVSIGSNGQLTYTPAANYHGADSFTYTVTSGGVTETTTVTINVVPVNDPLTTNVPTTGATNEDTPLVFSSANGNALTVADIDGDALTMTLSATNGVLTLAALAGVTVTGDGSGTVTLSGSAAAINAALNGLSFDPANDYNGVAAISVTTSDGTATVSNTITITINPVVDIVADSVATNEDTPVTFNVLTGTNGASADNFEGAPVVTSVTQGASGTVSFLADGTLVYTPDANFHGVDTFSYTVTSGGLTETTTVTVTVGDENDIPTTTGLADRNNLDGQVISIPVAASFADADGEALTYSATGLPAGLSINPVTGVISGTIDKNASQSGPYTVIVTASDGNPGGTISTSFTWNVTNPGPTATNDTAATDEDTLVTVSVLTNDSDPDGDPLTITSAVAGHGTISIDNLTGTISYTPELNFNGTDTIVYQISDGNGGVSTATVTVTVRPTNDIPTTTGLGNLVDNDNQVVSINVASAFSDLDGDTLTYTVSGLPPGLSFNPTTGEITGTIDPNASQPSGDESYTVTVTASDGNGGTISTAFTWRVLNIPPTSGDDVATTPEDTPVVVSVLSNDYDPDNDPLSITHINGQAITNGGPAVRVAHGEVSMTTDAFGNQVLIYTPDANFNGVDSLVYTVSDGNSGGDTATLTITVTPQNDAPTADALADLANADSDPVSINVSSFFDDIDAPNGDTLSFSAVGLPAGLSINPSTGVISGTIASSASQSGPYTVVVTATDNAGATVSSNFTWTVTNPAPTAIDDARTVTEGTPIATTAATGLITPNDTDPDHDALTVVAINGVSTSVDQPVAGSNGGTFTIAPDGSYTFNQNGAFEDLQVGESRLTTVTYTISDGDGGRSTATLIVTVTGANDSPVGTSIANIATTDNAPLTLATGPYFSDVDGDTLTFEIVGLPAGLTFDAGTGQITGTIDSSASQAGAAGVYSVTVTADDGHGGRTPVTFQITVVNPAPIAADDTAAATEDTPVSGNVLSNDSDPDGDSRSVQNFSIAGVSGTFNPGDTATIPGVGTVEINGNGAYTFTPDLNYNGPVPLITYTLVDADGATDTATLNIGPVAPVNDAPVSNPISAQTSTDGSPVTLNVSTSFSDVDGDPLTFVAVGLPTGLTIDPNTGVISGTIDHLASGSGPYTVTVSAKDPNGKITSQVFTWNVGNPSPTGSAIPDASGVDGTTVAIAAGAGFADPDGDTLTFSATGLPSGLNINPVTGEITGALGTSASQGGLAGDGVYVITVTAKDSQGAVVSQAFTYTVSNPPPTAGNDEFAGIEDTSITGSVGGNDQDPDRDTVTYTVSTGPTHGTLVFNSDGSFTYTPNPNYNATDGRDTFTYTITDRDGAIATATVTLTVAPVNDAPTTPEAAITTPEETAINGTLPGSDVDGDILAFTKATDPTHGTVVVNPDGTYTYTPALNYVGPDSFTYKVSDGNGGFVTGTVTINVTPINDAPVARTDTASVTEDTPSTGNVLGNDTDVDGPALSVTQFVIGGTTYTAGSTATLPGVGTLTIGTNGNFTFTPAPNYTGPVPTATYTMTDGSLTSTANLVLGPVSPVNDAPVASATTATTPEDTPIVGKLPLATDVDGDQVVFGKGSDPSHGTVVVNPDGTYTYIPAPNYNGPDTFTYTVSDGKGGVNTYTVSITVTPVNDAPVGPDVVVSTSQEAPLVSRVTATDIDGDNLTFSGPSAGPTHGQVTVNVDGTFMYVPPFGFVGTDSFSIIVEDGNGGLRTITVQVTVNPTAGVFNLPEPPFVVSPAPFVSSAPIIVDGIVLDTVNSISPLSAQALDLRVSGIVVNTVNMAGRLESVAGLNDNPGSASGPIQKIVELRELAESAVRAFPMSRGFWDLQSLTGFSVRMDIDNAAMRLGSAEAQQIVVDTLMRDRRIFVEISTTLDEALGRNVVGYSIVQANGRDLPRWVNTADQGLLLLEVPVGGGSLDLKITALFDDGSSITRAVTIQLATAEVQELRTVHAQPPLFEEQLRQGRGQ